MTGSLRMVSVCRSFPTAKDPSNGIFVLNRLAAMAAHADVEVIQQIPYLPGLRPVPAWAQAPGRSAGSLTVRHAPMLYIPGILKSLDSFWLERALRGPVGALHRHKPLDLIDAHFGYPEGVSGVRLARRLGVPAFITIRGFEAEFVHKKVIGGQLVRALRAATGCISVSHSLRELALRCGVEPERVAVVHNAIDSTTFHWGDRLEARSRLGLPPAVPLVVSVGHLIERKRHHVLLDAFASVRGSRPQALLAIVGGRSYESHYPHMLETRARELGIFEATRFLGNLPPTQVATWLQAADAFALATAGDVRWFP